MKIYKHLSLAQRYEIEALLLAGKSQSFIAELLGFDKSCISRELRRNTRKAGPGAKVYSAEYAQWCVKRRNEERYPNHRFTDSMRWQIKHWMENEKLSPELITQRGRQMYKDFVSHETIYQWLWAAKVSQRSADTPFRDLYKHLKHGGRRQKRGNYRQNRGCIPGRVSIQDRPKVVEDRQRFGDLEVDLMWGKQLKSGLLVIVDRATLKTHLRKVFTKDSSTIVKKVIQMMSPYKGLVKTFTYDNDLAFAKHELINRTLNATSFFTRPYTSQDKGTVENRIGVIRRFFPKKMDLVDVHHSRIKQVENYLNKREVRKFNYCSPNAVFLQMSKVALVT